MSKTFKKICTVLLTMMAMATWCGTALATWSTTDLGTLGGATTYAAGVNNIGQVVGYSSTSGNQQHAFLWTATAGIQDLGTLGGTTSQAFGINNSGQVVGTADNASGQTHACLWSSTGVMQDLGTLGGTFSFAYAINDTGQVIGHSRLSDGFTNRAFLWTATGGMKELGTLGGSSLAYGINASGQVVGASDTTAGQTHAFLWTPSGGMRDLGTLGGAISYAYGINNAGQVVGFSSTAAGQTHAFLWTATGGMQDLGTLGGTASSANGINNMGQIIGYSTDSGGAYRFFVYSDGRMYDLDKATTGSGWQLYSDAIMGLNDQGLIVGTGRLNGDYSHGWLLTQNLKVTAFTMPDTSTLNTVPISTLIANDSVGVTGYQVNESAVAPDPADINWGVNPPDSFTFAGSGQRTAYAWARDDKGNVSFGGVSRQVTVITDAAAPVVTAFVLDAPAIETDTVTISAFTATSDPATSITGYLVSEVPNAASLSHSTWSSTKPTTYTFSLIGTRTAYAWVRDGNGNISARASATITIPDHTPPVVTLFTMPANAPTQTVAITSYIADDNAGVTGYLVNESNTPPAPNDSRWRSTAWTNFTFSGVGPRTAYAWAKDAAGNVSLSASAAVTIIVGWTISDLGTLGGTGSYATGVNIKGQVVGYSTNAAGQNRAFVWSAGSGIQDLGTLGGSDSYARGINTSGQVVGDSRTSSNQTHAFLWSSTGGMQDLGTLGTFSTSQAFAINNVGQITGYSSNTGSTYNSRAFLWSAPEGMRDLGASAYMGTDHARYGTAINDTGQIAIIAYSQGAANRYSVLGSAAKGLQYLGSLGGAYGAAYGINNAGEVVGESAIGDNYDYVTHAYLWKDGKFTDLGTLGGTRTSARAINNQGQIVGLSYLRGNSTFHPFLLTDGRMIDLHDMVKDAGWDLSGTTAIPDTTAPPFSVVINDNGQIAGTGKVNGQTHAFLITPTLKVTSFTMPAVHDATTVPITSFTVTVSAGVAGYLVTESATAPGPDDPNWSPVAPTNFTFSGAGDRTAYAWAKDAAGNVSFGVGAKVKIGTETTPPTISSFTMPAASPSPTVPIAAFTADDNIGVTGYLVTESPTPPAVDDPAWSVSAPSGFTFSGYGVKTAFAWAKDAADNVSAGASQQVTVGVGAPLPERTIIDLGTLGGNTSNALALNNAGQVVGRAQTTGNAATHAFLWSRTGGMQDLRTLGGSTSNAFALNNAGQVVGSASLSDGNVHAFFWSNGVMKDLGTLGGTSSDAGALNEAGQIVGSSRYTGGGTDSHAYLYQNDFMLDLGVLPGDTRSGVKAINNSGTILGFSTGGSNGYQGFIWNSGVMTALPNTTSINCMNDAGQVGGSTTNSKIGNRESAAVWNQGIMTELGSALFPGWWSTVRAINNSGQILGAKGIPGFSSSGPFLLTDGKITDLATLGAEAGWNLFASYAIALNDYGQIAGYAPITINGTRRTHAFLLTPTLKVTKFTIPATSDSLTVPITTFNALYNVTGYMVTESPIAPAADDTRWSAVPPTSFTFSGDDARTAYAWARDAAGNVSAAASAPVTVTAPPPITDITSRVGVRTTGFGYSRVSKRFTGTMTVTNISDSAISGTLVVQLNNLTSGVTLTNASGTENGTPFINQAVSMDPGASVTIPLVFSDPTNELITFTYTVGLK